MLRNYSHHFVHNSLTSFDNREVQSKLSINIIALSHAVSLMIAPDNMALGMIGTIMSRLCRDVLSSLCDLPDYMYGSSLALVGLFSLSCFININSRWLLLSEYPFLMKYIVFKGLI